jgi:hypothetical protein
VENYGQPSHTYLVHHGFFIESSAFDCVHFTLSITTEEKDQIDWALGQSIVQVTSLAPPIMWTSDGSCSNYCLCLIM